MERVAFDVCFFDVSFLMSKNNNQNICVQHFIGNRVLMFPRCEPCISNVCLQNWVIKMGSMLEFIFQHHGAMEHMLWLLWNLLAAISGMCRHVEQPFGSDFWIVL